MRYIGVDLHMNSFTVCFRDSNGSETLKTYAMDKMLDFLFEVNGKDIVAVESTGNTRFFVEIVEKHVKKVVVVDPNNFDVIKKSTKKTDEVDARALAKFLSKDMLPEARMKTGLQAELSSMIATRDTLVKQRTALINSMHNIFNAHGIKRKKEELTTIRGLNKVQDIGRENGCSPLALIQLGVLQEQIRSLNEGIKKLDAQIIEKGKTLDGHHNLSSIKGIGDKAATILLTVIGKIDDFADEGKLAAYFGIVPRVYRTNQTVHYGRITKDGSKIGRTTLVQCTLVAIRYSPYLSAFYHQVAKRRGSGKAIIAAARKLLGIIYKTLKEGWVFTDFTKFEYTKA